MYLLVKHAIKGTVTQATIEKKDLLDIKDRMGEALIDLDRMTYFDPKINQWVEIKQFEGYDNGNH
jgi:hypothetical protein